MRKKLLFPLVVVFFELFVFVVPALFPLVYLFSIPSMLIVNELSRSLGGPRDTTYFVIAGALLQAFLIGVVWDVVADQVAKKSDP